MRVRGQMTSSLASMTFFFSSLSPPSKSILGILNSMVVPLAGDIRVLVPFFLFVFFVLGSLKKNLFVFSFILQSKFLIFSFFKFAPESFFSSFVNF